MQPHKTAFICLSLCITSCIMTGCSERKSNYDISKYEVKTKAKNTKYWIEKNISPMQIPNAKMPDKKINVQQLLIKSVASYYSSYFQPNIQEKTKKERDVIAARLKEIIQSQDDFLKSSEEFKTSFPKGISENEISKMDAEELTPIILFQITNIVYDLSVKYTIKKEYIEDKYELTRAIALDLIDNLEGL